jgi:hypothetical protein
MDFYTPASGGDDRADRNFNEFLRLFFRQQQMIQFRRLINGGSSPHQARYMVTHIDEYGGWNTAENMAALLEERLVFSAPGNSLSDTIDLLDSLLDGPDHSFSLTYMDENGTDIEYELWFPVGRGLFYIIDAVEQVHRIERDRASHYIGRKLRELGGDTIEVKAYRRRPYSKNTIRDYLS